MTTPPLARDIRTGLADAASARGWLDAAGREGFVQAMLVGLHRFQSVNLAYGTFEGDRVLAEIAQRIADFTREELGPDAMAARLGGGEFLVACAAPISRQRWQWLAEALGRTIARPLAVGADRLRLAPRTALLRGQAGEAATSLIDRLDQALASLQRSSGRRVLWADGSHLARGRSAARLEADLLGAMDRCEIMLLFQPQFRVDDGTIAGAEALARWDHPALGRVGAETLFAIADRGDHVAQLSQHIAERALAAAAGWPDHLRLSLNVTAEDFAVGDFAATMAGAIEASGFAPSRLTLEITEQTLVADYRACATALEALAARGVSVALDDFGTGFSNFHSLKALPLDALKLDGSLVRDVARDPRDRAILGAILAMARALRLKVVAEGVEDEGQLAILREEGCALYQGFLRSEPLAAGELAALAGKGS